MSHRRSRQQAVISNYKKRGINNNKLKIKKQQLLLRLPHNILNT
jgi:hypothetical protein